MTKRTVYADGRVAEPFRYEMKSKFCKNPKRVWFYAGRGKFHFLAAYDGNAQTEMIDVPTSMIRKALALVDSVRPVRRKKGAKR